MTHHNTEDFLPISGTDFVEFFVSNAKQTAFFYQTAFGFEPFAYRGLETGETEQTSYALKQGKVILVFTSSLIENSPINEHVVKHGDGVKYIALTVPDATASFDETCKRGAIPYMDPIELEDDNGIVTVSGIHIYGDTVHLFIERKDYKGIFLPGFEKWDPDYTTESIPFKHIDHIVANVELHKMDEWTDFYKEVMGFTQLVSYDDKDISTEYTALMSKVMTNGNQRIKFPINEPAKGKKRSQIQEYIDFYNGAGVQHIAIATEDIVSTIKTLKSRGVEFLNIPMSYYEHLLQRVGEIDEDLKQLAETGILVDRDEDGYLLQTFTKPLEDRPTLFFEIIERKGAKSFGKGNFKALFEAMEREQQLRGTL